jgi:hypothetical protein
MKYVINIVSLIFICCLLISCSDIKGSLFGDDNNSSVISDNTKCNKLSLEDYSKYDCIAHEVNYNAYLNTIKDAKPSECDSFNADLERRNNVCLKNVKSKNDQQEANRVEYEKSHEIRNMDSNIEYSLLCNKEDVKCYIGLASLPTTKEMLHVNVYVINFVRFNNNVVTVNMTNNSPENITVYSFKKDIELRLISNIGVFVKIRYSVSAFTPSDDQLGFTNLSDYDQIYPGENITLNYKLPQIPSSCSNYGLYLPDEDKPLRWYFNTTVNCSSNNVVNNARTL